MVSRRLAVATMVALVLPLAAGQAQTDGAQEKAWSALGDGAIVLFRHANAPGGGDPPGLRLGDCSTQRNLDGAGRDQAGRIGSAFRQRGIVVGNVMASQWCRTVDTARLAFGQTIEQEPAFNSFFEDREKEAEQTRAATIILERWKGPGTLVVVTHQVNITALTGVFPASGEGVVARMADGKLTVKGRMKP